MSLKEKLKSAKVMTEHVVIDGDEYLVRGLSRIRKNELVEKNSPKGRLDTAAFEGAVLAECVLDPATSEPVMPDPADWDIPSHVAGPLVKACLKVCGFDEGEARQLEKK